MGPRYMRSSEKKITGSTVDATATKKGAARAMMEEANFMARMRK